MAAVTAAALLPIVRKRFFHREEHANDHEAVVAVSCALQLVVPTLELRSRFGKGRTGVHAPDRGHKVRKKVSEKCHRSQLNLTQYSTLTRHSTAPYPQRRGLQVILTASMLVSAPTALSP